ncbi:MAG: tRNA (guanosine(37)-N1)-methyltransferase TrmD [Coriobacteriia bacterium]|nr:tRNA (guanosine(37)-N1)-methyltransferase TrmD [Coriobacteriia bacterium]MBN2840975.1 tRNA (guanosine(37)-N1)-methyltransferase TrmD [Coriobacteriia bacterium]
MRIDIISVLPEMFGPVLDTSILGRAQASGVIEIAVHDLRDWTDDRHRTTDDYPFGGGPGMVMKPEPVYRALDAVTALSDAEPFVVLTSPQGRRLDQALVRELAARPRLLILCGRYEGFDERILARADLEVSIGDYVLTGGELPALVLTDAVSRLQPGALGCSDSATDESFSEGLLEYPQYTRPAIFRGMEVPPVLVSGDHARIAAWRRRESLRRTAERRPDLLVGAALSPEESEFVNGVVQKENADRD